MGSIRATFRDQWIAAAGRRRGENEDAFGARMTLISQRSTVRSYDACLDRSSRARAFAWPHVVDGGATRRSGGDRQRRNRARSEDGNGAW